MSKAISHPLDAELRDLWQRRHELSEKEWRRLREIIFTVLLPLNYGMYTSLAGHRRQDLIEQFITVRVYMPATAPNYRSKSIHVGALQGEYYRNFLIDVWRQEKRERTRPGKKDDIGETILKGWGEEPDLSLNEIDTLKVAGFSVEGVAKSAGEFLANSPQWVLFFLGLHHCPDEDERVPLSVLARERQIPNYHAKALELGITSERGGFRNYEEFSATRLGRWLGFIGVPINLEHVALMGLMLKILCWVSLYQVKEQGLA